MRTRHFVRLFLAWCLLLSLGCTHQVRPRKPGPVSELEADSQSGLDGVAKGAVALALSGLKEDDVELEIFEGSGEVSWPARQRTRWRRAALSSPPNDAYTPLRCELRYQPESAVLHLDAWNDANVQLPDHHQISSGLYVAEVFLDKVGPVFLRVRAERPQDAARFTLRCSWHYDAEYYEGRRGHGGYRRPVINPEPYEERGTEGRVLSFEQKDGVIVLRIDKGITAGVKVGQRGTLLAGKSGREPLSGGEFQVRETSETECIADVKLKSIGRNRRIVLDTK